MITAIGQVFSYIFLIIRIIIIIISLGEYRGAAHSECNLQVQNSKKIPVFFHNLSGYDGHLIMQEIQKADFTKVDIIAKTLEHYVNFECKTEDSDWSLDFKDSNLFLNSSLEKLTKNLKAKADNDGGQYQEYFKNTYEYFNEKFIDEKNMKLDDSAFQLLLRKGVFPYSYITSIDTLEERYLPPKESFKNDLSNTDCSDADYEHAQKVWRVFGCRKLKDYHDLYMELDTHLLADIFERFRSESKMHYELDPAHFCTAPSLSWNACLRYTKQKLEIIRDVDMNLFIDSALVGGVSAARNPHLKANNPQVMGYDPMKKMTWLMLVDCNNQVKSYRKEK